MDGIPEVVHAISERLREAGSLSVEEVIELALYHPRGLYGRSVPSIGRGGQFTTCARIDPALGAAVARWLLGERRNVFGLHPRWHAVEIGGGDGSLSRAVLEALPRRARLGLTLHLVERSEPAAALQVRTLTEPRRAALRRRGGAVGRARSEPAGRSVSRAERTGATRKELRDEGAGQGRTLRAFGARICWQPTVEAALKAAGGRALLYSNELVDAFPAVVFEWRDGRWWEVRLVEGTRGLQERLVEAAAWFEPGKFTAAGLAGCREGCRVEVHRSYREWLQRWGPRLQRGAMLTIDYGAERDELYGRRTYGTLRAYLANQRLDDREELFRRLGQQDLTCDVNFSDLIRWGAELGWETKALWTQREFLSRMGQLDDEGARPGLGFLARPDGAGTAFRVLWQRVGTRQEGLASSE